jgi:hypothetical protein
MTTHAAVPDWLLERYALGELPPEKMEAVRAALEADPEGARRLAAVTHSNNAILAAYPPRVVAAAVQQRARREAGEGRASWLSGLIMVAAVALALLAIRTPDAGTGLHPDCVVAGDETICFKGGPQLLVYRQRGREEPEMLHNGSVAHDADRLQLKYRANQRRYGLIASIDGRGVLTLHTRDAVALDAPGDAEAAVALPRSYELDDAPRFERFFFVASLEPFDAEAVLDAIEALPLQQDPEAELVLPDGLYQDSILLQKVP